MGVWLCGWLTSEQTPNDISINLSIMKNYLPPAHVYMFLLYRSTTLMNFLAIALRLRAFIFQLSQVCYFLPRYCVSIACSVENYCFPEPTKTCDMPNLMLCFLCRYTYDMYGFKVGPLPSTAFDKLFMRMHTFYMVTTVKRTHFLTSYIRILETWYSTICALHINNIFIFLSMPQNIVILLCIIRYAA